MSTRTSATHVGPQVIMDWQSADRDFGGQIDWDVLPDKYQDGAFKVVADGAHALGATTLAIDPALEKALPKGTLLNFGQRAAVTVTVNANAAQGATSISVDALSGPIPNGTILDFGPGAGLFAVLTAAAAAGATSLTVEALPEAIASGKTATYAARRKYAELSAAAAAGATSLPVVALPAAIDDGDTAYAGGKAGSKRLPAYTVMCKLSSGKRVPRVDRPGSETAYGLLAEAAAEDSETAAMSGFGFITKAQVLENLLPEADSNGDLDATIKTELLNRGFTFYDYQDTR